MIALDTSAILRYLTDDEPRLSAAVARHLESGESIGLSSLVLLEAAYALRSPPYGRDNPEIADALIELLALENVTLFDLSAELASAAIAGVRHLSARHVADALIAAAARGAGAAALITNDRKFASEVVPVRQLIR